MSRYQNTDVMMHRRARQHSLDTIAFDLFGGRETQEANNNASNKVSASTSIQPNLPFQTNDRRQHQQVDFASDPDDVFGSASTKVSAWGAPEVDKPSLNLQNAFSPFNRSVHPSNSRKRTTNHRRRHAGTEQQYLEISREEEEEAEVEEEEGKRLAQGKPQHKPPKKLACQTENVHEQRFLLFSAKLFMVSFAAF